jgi:beta-phosphoglucomutase family hydrolase
MLMKIKGVLWDLDGVLVDTGEFHYQAWSRTLRRFHIPYSRDLFLETFGMNNWNILVRLLDRPPEQALYRQIDQQKEALFRQIIHNQVKALPGVIETLQSLDLRGISQAVASSAPLENIDALVDELGIRDCFKAIVSGSQLAGKPAPDVFLASAHAINLPAHSCLVIEDSVAGVAGARAAGMACLAVTNTNPAEALSQANYVVDSLIQLPSSFWDELLG